MNRIQKFLSGEKNFVNSTDFQINKRDEEREGMDKKRSKSNFIRWFVSFGKIDNVDNDRRYCDNTCKKKKKKVFIFRNEKRIVQFHSISKLETNDNFELFVIISIGRRVFLFDVAGKLQLFMMRRGGRGSSNKLRIMAFCIIRSGLSGRRCFGKARFNLFMLSATSGKRKIEFREALI